MDWDLVRSILTAVLATATIIATALVGVLFGSLKTLRDTSNDLRARVGDLEKERAEDKADLSESRSENAILKSMVTGKVEWIALTDQLEEHHRQALDWWRRADGRLEAIPEAIREAVEEAVKVAVRTLREGGGK